MSFDAQIPPNEEYLHIRVAGQDPFDEIRRRMAGASRRGTVVRVLCELDLEGAEPLHVLECVKACFSVTFPRYVRLSMVCGKESLNDKTFAKTIMKKHKGLFLGVFTDKDEARAWLLKDS